MNLSEHFTLQEATLSGTASRAGIDNSCPDIFIPTLIKTANCMEAVRLVLLYNPIKVDSWYRCKALNRLIGSKDTSQHMLGEAVDFISPRFGSPLDICRKLIQCVDTINYDQLILEHEWVHISFSSRNRRQVISLLDTGDYAPGLTDKKGNPL